METNHECEQTKKDYQARSHGCHHVIIARMHSVGQVSSSIGCITASEDVDVLTANPGRKGMSTPPSVGRRAATTALHSSVMSMAMTITQMIKPSI
jgi:hypothetical protein